MLAHCVCQGVARLLLLTTIALCFTFLYLVFSVYGVTHMVHQVLAIWGT
jgi:hypothetical protein